MKKQVKKASQPKKLRAIQTSRQLRVSHRQHTGRLLSRQSTSYPLLIMILLCVGVILSGWTHLVTANQVIVSGAYKVKASVPGPPPPHAAVITSPLNGSSGPYSPITVRGTCDPGTYVKLLRNNVMSGVALCNAGGHFAIYTGLFHGSNILLVKVYNFANIVGPDSAPVIITYTGFDTTLVIKNDYQIQGVYTGHPCDWTIGLDGGSPPYALDVEWGDGGRDVYSRSGPGIIQLTHTYHRHGAYKGSYTIQLTLTDVNGHKAYLQLFAIVNDVPGAAATADGNTTGGQARNTLSGIAGWGHYIWPSYGVTVLMLVSFWLGERYELKYLRPRLRHSHR